MTKISETKRYSESDYDKNTWNWCKFGQTDPLGLNGLDIETHTDT
jgi:hypothetical protein